jgi:diguanylate cyclase (GGDEF)-like protein
VGVSIGVVVCPEHGSEAESLLDLADRAMYRAKHGGRNRVESE